MYKVYYNAARGRRVDEFLRNAREEKNSIQREIYARACVYVWRASGATIPIAAVQPS